MATIKSYSDLQQSKVLSEILPLESADMCWQQIYDENHMMPDHRIELIPYRFYSGLGFPAWSLSALLGVLPYCPDLSKHTDGKWYITTYPNDVHTCLMAYDNPVDACVAMIEKLHGLKML